MKCLHLLLLAVLLPVCGQGQAADATLQKLQAKIADDPYSEYLVTTLVNEVGPRFAGSDGYEHAVIWALQKLQAAGLKNVHAEPVILPRWVRGRSEVSLEVSSVDNVPLAAAAIGGSVGTDAQGIEAEVVRVESLDQLRQLTTAQVRGRIVFIDQRIQPSRDASTYVAAYPVRKYAPAEAGRKGAAAILIRSLSTAQDDVPHTGDLDYGDAPKIPALALSNVAADRLSAVVRAGGATVTIKLDTRELGAVYSAYVVADVPGQTDEIVLLGAHLDSWDITPGAEDDGAGVAIVTGAARAILRHAKKPKRTIRVVLYADEEFGEIGARAYADAHAAELGRHVLAMEADGGSGPVWRLDSKLPDVGAPFRLALLDALKPFGIADGSHDGGGGSDIKPLMMQGVPVLGPRQDMSRYFDVHHSAADTLDHLDRAGLRQNVAVYASAAWLAANWPGSLGRLPPTMP
ncbi:M20/M25/M40 family metallo-hydrolase [Solimonas terrae]|uniref:Carboxypeptidase Q n=1 Tax=Solimonas terrae TaxID=1396819 RepID=A0A6M2BPD9_9GAMM|nr:M20/M25/M40 family metallo-hydrolase [Solimonas terrae]NGY04466.1 M20/M25/M40 family metallo-hydrolase [Solimonas terrae]